MRDHNASPGTGWILAYDSGGRIACRAGGTNLVSSTTVASIRDGWHHFAVTKDGDDVRLYLDGRRLDLPATRAGQRRVGRALARHAQRQLGTPSTPAGAPTRSRSTTAPSPPPTSASAPTAGRSDDGQRPRSTGGESFRARGDAEVDALGLPTPADRETDGARVGVGQSDAQLHPGPGLRSAFPKYLLRFAEPWVTAAVLGVNGQPRPRQETVTRVECGQSLHREAPELRAILPDDPQVRDAERRRGG